MINQSCRHTVQPNRVRRYEEVVAYCHTVFEQTGEMPSYTNIASALRIHDRATVRQYVAQAESYGLLSRTGEIRGGRGSVPGRRIRLGTPEEAAQGRQTIKLGRELAD